MMVLLTANLKAGWVAVGGVDSEIRDLRIAFCRSQGLASASLEGGRRGLAAGEWERGQEGGKGDIR